MKTIRCKKCGSRAGRGRHRLCRPCDPAPVWAHFTIARWVPYVVWRWF